ncbi:unnamed protein product, partial [Mesorhabditis belari]|uniref:Thioredoxin domain-containing protein n=1 Tax=Mesorhabditis belari TaxID=2138241 RepID=A0AAF3FG49_9BILA
MARFSALSIAGLALLLSYVEAKKMFTQDPVQPIKRAVNIPSDEPVLVLVYRSTCPRSQRTIPRFQRAAKILEGWGMKTLSLEYNETGWEYMKIAFPLKKFPAIVMYPGDGSKLRYDEKDPPQAAAEDFVSFAWSNRMRRV